MFINWCDRIYIHSWYRWMERRDSPLTDNTQDYLNTCQVSEKWAFLFIKTHCIYYTTDLYSFQSLKIAQCDDNSKNSHTIKSLFFHTKSEWSKFIFTLDRYKNLTKRKLLPTTYFTIIILTRVTCTTCVEFISLKLYTLD